MIADLLHIVVALFCIGLALGALVFLIGAWGGLSFKELPLFSEGDEPTTVKRLPEIDLPLDKPGTSNHSWRGDGSGHAHD